MAEDLEPRTFGLLEGLGGTPCTSVSYTLSTVRSLTSLETNTQVYSILNLTPQKIMNSKNVGFSGRERSLHLVLDEIFMNTRENT